MKCPICYQEDFYLYMEYDRHWCTWIDNWVHFRAGTYLVPIQEEAVRAENRRLDELIRRTQIQISRLNQQLHDLIELRRTQESESEDEKAHTPADRSPPLRESQASLRARVSNETLVDSPGADCPPAVE